ncbi:MAG: ATP-binding protein [Candidatus Methylomirabilales bacterium]
MTSRYDALGLSLATYNRTVGPFNMAKTPLTPKHLAILQAIASAMSRTQNLDRVLALAAAKSLKVLTDGGCEIRVLDRRTSQLVLKVRRGRGKGLVLMPPSDTANESRLGADRRAVIIGDTLRDPRAKQFVAREELFRSFAAYPLRADRQLVGLLTLLSRKRGDFVGSKHTLFAEMAEQLGIAIQTSFLYQDAKEKTDRLAEELERRVQERTAQLERASQAKSEFLAAMSHELRTPLNAIIGFAELLEERIPGPLNDKQLRYVRHVLQGGRHLLALINDILDLGKVEAGELRLHLERISVADLLQGGVLGMRQSAIKKDVSLSLEIDRPLPEIAADPIRLRQVVDNLLSNAIKFTMPGGAVRVSARVRSPRSEVRSQAQGIDHILEELETSDIGRRTLDSDFVEITVQDAGIGIRAEDLPKLFTPFTQLDQSLARRHEGTGLGLALSKRLVDLHRGWIWAESPGQGKGSIFRVLLPFGESERLPFQILLVDDEPGFRMALETILGRAGFTVHAVATGSEALAKVKETPIGLILLDLVLPDMNGRDVLTHLKKGKNCRGIPVVVFTGATETDPQEILRLGASEFLTKPFSETVLLEVVTRTGWGSR